MALKMGGGIDPNRVVNVLIVSLLFLYVITSIIDFRAITSDDPNAQIFKEEFDYEEMASGFYKYLIVGMAAWLAWTFTAKAGARFDKKALITVVIAIAILYFVYNKFLAPQLGWESIEFAAYQLQAIVAP